MYFSASCVAIVIQNAICPVDHPSMCAGFAAQGALRHRDRVSGTLVASWSSNPVAATGENGLPTPVARPLGVPWAQVRGAKGVRQRSHGASSLLAHHSPLPHRLGDALTNRKLLTFSLVRADEIMQVPGAHLDLPGESGAMSEPTRRQLLISRRRRSRPSPSQGRPASNRR